MTRMQLVMGAALLFAAAPALADDPQGGGTPPPAGGAGGGAAGGGAVEGPGKKMTVGADVIGVLPLGDYSNASSFAIGAAGRFEYAVNPKLSITARVGYLYHLGTAANTSLYIIPVHVGASYLLMPKLTGWAELGLEVIGVSVDFMGMSASNSDNKFGGAVGVGYQVMPKLTVKGGFYYPGSLDSSNGMGGTTSTTLYGIIFSAGYDFASF